MCAVRRRRRRRSLYYRRGIRWADVRDVVEGERLVPAALEDGDHQRVVPSRERLRCAVERVVRFLCYGEGSRRDDKVEALFIGVV